MIEGANVVTIYGEMDIDIDVHVPEGLLNSERFDELMASYVPEMAAKARDFWMTEAGQRLRTSKKDYQDGIQLTNTDKGGFVLTLSGALAVAVEEGAPGFDMNPGLQGKNVPLNLDREVVDVRPPWYSNPTFRKGGNFKNHPGWSGKNIIADVQDYIENELIPEYTQKVIEEL